MKTEFSLFRKSFFIGFIFLAACQTNGDTKAINLVHPSPGGTIAANTIMGHGGHSPFEGDIIPECPPEDNIKVKNVGAYISLSDYDLKTRTATAQLIPYFYEIQKDMFTLYKSHEKFLYNPGVHQLSQRKLRHSSIHTYVLHDHDKINVRRSPNENPGNVIELFNTADFLIGRGPVKTEDGSNWLQVIRDKTIIGNTAERFFRKLEPVILPPTYKLDCSLNIPINKKIRDSAKIHSKFDVTFKKPIDLKPNQFQLF